MTAQEQLKYYQMAVRAKFPEASLVESWTFGRADSLFWIDLEPYRLTNDVPNEFKTILEAWEDAFNNLNPSQHGK